MNTLPPPAKALALLSFDFDGTLHHAGNHPPVPPHFFTVIEKLRETHGAIWGINTGRAISYMIEGFAESNFPFLPDWVIAREREIHFPTTSGRWQSSHEWNLRGTREIHELFKQLHELFTHIRHEIKKNTGAQWMEMEGEPAGIIAQSEEEMAWIVELIESLAKEEPHLAWQRNSIYLRFGHRDFQKGSSLRQIAHHYGLSKEHCFAIGDSHNDFEMLDPSSAGMIACPANAVIEIKEKVLHAQGLVTQTSYGEGSIEALFHYFKI